jgi:G3E family GTPase
LPEAPGQADHRLPVSVITGFLGSGKTTLLRRLLADPRMGMTAVLVNEFGEVGLDHLLLRKVDEDIVLLNSGCLCCSVRDDLVETLDDLASKRRSRLVPEFVRVAIETSGLADPAPIVHTLMTDGSLAPAYRLTGIVATIDGAHGEGQLDDHEEAVKQVAMADRLVITKTDLAGTGPLGRLRTRLAGLARTARVFDAGLQSGPGPDQLFDADAFSVDGRGADVARWLAEEARAATADHGAEAHRHDDRIGTFCLTAETPLRWDDFTDWLTLLLAARGDQLLRIKGLVNVAGRDRPVVVHGVQHVFYPPTELEGWPDGDRRSRIVFITKDLPRAGVERAFADMVRAAGEAVPRRH